MSGEGKKENEQGGWRKRDGSAKERGKGERGWGVEVGEEAVERIKAVCA